MTQSHDTTIWLETAAGESWLTKTIAEMKAAPRHTFSRAECDSIIAMVLGRQATPLPGTSARKLRLPPSDGLKSAAQAAAKLGCSIKTLNGHVASGALRYVDIGHGKRRPRRMFTDADLDEFIANQSRKDVPCPSTRTETAARRISTSTSKCEVIGFTARRDARRGVKPKK
jgi:hypothetical protein